MIKYYITGGYVRDRLLNIPSKDVDLACEASSFDEMVNDIINNRKGEIYLSRPEYFSVRCKMPFQGKVQCVDVTLCRKDGFYSDFRHPDSVEVGTLYDDLSRRDYTAGALAEDEDGKLIDYFGGVDDINNRILRCVGNTEDRLREDSIRILRGLRFFITKGLRPTSEIVRCIENPKFIDLLENVSEERVYDELMKMFKFDTLLTLKILYSFPYLKERLFSKKIWLQPSLKER